MSQICSILFEGLLIFAFCLALHVVMWRIRRPASYRTWLPALVIVFLVIGPSLGWSIAQRTSLDGDAQRLTHWTAVLLLHGSLSGVYIIGYTLISAFSPSVEILKLLQRTPGGLLEAEVKLPFLDHSLSGDRVGTLLAGDLIRTNGDDVTLAPRAKVLTTLVLAYRHLLGLPDGAGG